jgi:CheY-like chemotaxis protein
LRDPWLRQRQAFHDAANWLTVLMGHLEALRRAPGSSRHLELARRAARAAHRLCALPPDSASVSVAVDAGRLARRLVLHLEPAAGAQNVELREEVGHGLPTVQADPSGLEDALLNLLRNAIEASPPGGVVRLSLAPVPEGFVRIGVQDEGEGMPESDPDPVAELGRSDKEGVDRGLGLSRVRGWLDSMGATLEIDRAPGGGASVGFTLAAALPQSRKEPRVGGLRVLLVEDDVAVSEVLSLLLAADGHAVERSGDCESALAAFEPGVFGLVLCDQNLPDGTGEELLRRLSSLDPKPACFLVTGAPESVHSPDPSRIRVLAKPVSRDDLRRAAAVAAENAQTPDQARASDA